ESEKTQRKTSIDVVNQFDRRALLPTGIFNDFIQYVDGDDHLIRALVLAAIQLAQLVEKLRIGDCLGADDDAVNAGLQQFADHLDASDTATVLYLHLRFLQYVEQVLLVAKIALRAIQINDVNQISAVGMEPGDHFFQCDRVVGHLVIIAFPQADDFFVQYVYSWYDIHNFFGGLF